MVFVNVYAVALQRKRYSVSRIFRAMLFERAFLRLSSSCRISVPGWEEDNDDQNTHISFHKKLTIRDPTFR